MSTPHDTHTLREKLVEGLLKEAKNDFDLAKASAGREVSFSYWFREEIAKALTTYGDAREAAAREEAASTREELEAALAQIGWSIEGSYPNTFISDHDNKRTEWRVMSDRLELSGASEHTATCFSFKGAQVKVLEDGDAVSFGTPQCFILFMNHDIAREQRKATLTPTDYPAKQDNNVIQRHPRTNLETY